MPLPSSNQHDPSKTGTSTAMKLSIMVLRPSPNLDSRAARAQDGKDWMSTHVGWSTTMGNFIYNPKVTIKFYLDIPISFLFISALSPFK